jgi:hypothetical protein
MRLLDKLLGPKVVEQDELTDASRWSESAVPGRLQDWLDNNIFDEEPLIESLLRSDDIN